MPLKLLNELNGNRRGAFRKYLNSLEHEPRIAWYPSAGHDFRDLLYLNPEYCRLNPVKMEPILSDFFLHTDYYSWGSSIFTRNNELIYHDDRTSVMADHMEELPRLNIPVNVNMYVFQKK